jgi:chemotaxis protein histidine kinase CheA
MPSSIALAALLTLTLAVVENPCHDPALDLTGFLRCLGLDAHQAKLAEEGATAVSDLAFLEAADFEEIGIASGDAASVTAALAGRKQAAGRKRGGTKQSAAAKTKEAKKKRAAKKEEEEVKAAERARTAKRKRQKEAKEAKAKAAKATAVKAAKAASVAKAAKSAKAAKEEALAKAAERGAQKMGKKKEAQKRKAEAAAAEAAAAEAAAAEAAAAEAAAAKQEAEKAAAQNAAATKAKPEYSAVLHKAMTVVLHKFYAEHNPEKADDVEDILAKYAGREVELFRQLATRYPSGAAYLEGFLATFEEGAPSDLDKIAAEHGAMDREEKDDEEGAGQEGDQWGKGKGGDTDGGGDPATDGGPGAFAGLVAKAGALVSTVLGWFGGLGSIMALFSGIGGFAGALVFTALLPKPIAFAERVEDLVEEWVAKNVGRFLADQSDINAFVNAEMAKAGEPPQDKESAEFKEFAAFHNTRISAAVNEKWFAGGQTPVRIVAAGLYCYVMKRYPTAAWCLLLLQFSIYVHRLTLDKVSRVCEGVRGCARVCAGCARVCEGVRGCARVCEGVRGGARGADVAGEVPGSGTVSAIV